ncbi:MAG: PQQ-binding-like beta-propeller repeat protein, partial [Planctomycetes bacterium]|nr:PQQ-binding-like beta-propeller repeat protein [Planctomycetota bacterium]
EAIPVLVDLLSDTPLELAWQAEELLGRLAGDQAPLASLGAGAPDERCKCRLAWEEWWRNKGVRLDLAKIDPDGHPLGLTLLVVYDGFRGTGRVWECGSDGKARWEITDVQNPIDAQVLPGGRVLIAEHGGRRVTERDHQGKVLWEYALDAPASDCQRLPNGNTFISTWPNQILEVTPDHKVVFSYHSPQGMITSAQKLRNGHIVYVTQGGTLGEVDETGKEVKTLKFHYSPGWRLGVEALPGGRFLVTHQGAGRVVEYDSTGKVLWECSVPSPTAASRLANGHTLVCSNDKRLVEVDRKGQTVNVQALDGRPFRVRPR